MYRGKRVCVCICRLDAKPSRREAVDKYEKKTILKGLREWRAAHTMRSQYIRMYNEIEGGSLRTKRRGSTRREGGNNETIIRLNGFI